MLSRKDSFYIQDKQVKSKRMEKDIPGKQLLKEIIEISVLRSDKIGSVENCYKRKGGTLNID